MNIDLSAAEARLLDQHLTRHIAMVERELVRTDKHEMQHELAREVDTLRSIRERIAAQIASQGASAVSRL